MRMTWLPFVVEIITSLLVSVCSRNVTLCFLKQISWSTRIFLINDEVEWVIMGGFNKCRWSGSKKSDIAWIKLCIIWKKASFSFCRISYFLLICGEIWTTFFERHPTGPEVLAQLFQMFWHTERESFWKLALDSHSFLFLLQYSVSVISFCDYYFCLKCLLNAIVLLDYCILLFSFRYNTFTPSVCVWFVFSRSFLSCCQATFQKCCIVLIKALCAICIVFWCLSVGTSQRDTHPLIYFWKW